MPMVHIDKVAHIRCLQNYHSATGQDTPAGGCQDESTAQSLLVLDTEVARRYPGRFRPTPSRSCRRDLAQRAMSQSASGLQMQSSPLADSH